MRQPKIMTVAPRLARVAREEILHYFAADSCIASTDIVLRVLAHYRIEAKPLPVQLLVLNPPFTRRMAAGAAFPESVEETDAWEREDGSWPVGVGFPDPEMRSDGGARAGKWAGHLVAWVPAGRFGIGIDASLDQASRPERQIVLPGVLVFQAERDWRKGGRQATVRRSDGTSLIYEAVPDNVRYKVTPAWLNRGREKSVIVERIIGRMEGRELPPRPEERRPTAEPPSLGAAITGAG